ncbi:zinc metallochaperone AztD [Nocardioides luteus]|uniref:zinc metallochaperone AztD n=1 Tax=Nocardioides luteus TaxID=1844 RepID=UPI0018C9F78F|nr:zinc metallochaperone AztD [Nocardioides luteus]MBG6094209.1 DNA-binding beta-propeller fold protein YncE [Nocardioides luteus]
MHTPQNRALRAVTAVAGMSLALSACGSTAEGEEPTAKADKGSRLAVSYANGIAVLDGETLEVVDEFETEEFVRLNPIGDGRNLAVTTSKGFQVLDTRTPELTDLVFPADTGGHVVHHGDTTVLYADGSGETTIFDTAALGDAGKLPETTTWTAPEAHHGVSIVLEDGTLLTTVGTEESRSGAIALTPKGSSFEQIAANDTCPGIHGEGTAADEAVVFGCEDGALLYRDGAFEKLQAPDEFGRMGNAYVSETSPLIVGDYKTDPDAEGYLLDMVTLIDTEKSTLKTVSLPEGVEYTFRDVARGPEDLAYILATDGSIHVLDPATGTITDEYPVVKPWEGPVEWQDPHPAIKVDGDIAYVTEPATNTVHAVDLTSGEITASVELDEQPNEIALS